MQPFDFFSQEDVALFDKLEKFSLTGGSLPPEFPLPSSAKETILRIPDEKYSFLHEAVIYSFQGVLFAAWYACPKTELHGEAAIQFRVSKDGGKTWEEEKTLITDKTGAILYCPPVFGEEDGAKKQAEIMEQTRDAKGGLVGCAMVSDAFFPFRDGAEVGIREGITSIVQPGGAIRDWDVIDCCNDAGVAMVFTGQRSFRH